MCTNTLYFDVYAKPGGYSSYDMGELDHRMNIYSIWLDLTGHIKYQIAFNVF